MKLVSESKLHCGHMLNYDVGASVFEIQSNNFTEFQPNTFVSGTDPSNSQQSWIK